MTMTSHLANGLESRAKQTAIEWHDSVGIPRYEKIRPETEAEVTAAPSGMPSGKELVEVVTVRAIADDGPAAPSAHRQPPSTEKPPSATGTGTGTGDDV